MPPQRQHRRVQFIVGRWREPLDSERKGRVRFWQFAIWLRQCLLLLISSIGAAHLDESEGPQARTLIVWLQLGLSILVLLVALTAQVRVGPFAYPMQNALEAALLASAVVVFVLSGVYDHITAADVSADQQRAVEYVLLATLIGSFVLVAVAAVRDARGRSKAHVLAATDAAVNARLIDALRSGTVRLMRCGWLRDPASQEHLGKGPTGRPTRDAPGERRQAGQLDLTRKNFNGIPW